MQPVPDIVNAHVEPNRIVTMFFDRRLVRERMRLRLESENSVFHFETVL